MGCAKKKKATRETGKQVGPSPYLLFKLVGCGGRGERIDVYKQGLIIPFEKPIRKHFFTMIFCTIQIWKEGGVV